MELQKDEVGEKTVLQKDELLRGWNCRKMSFEGMELQKDELLRGWNCRKMRF